MKKQKRIFSLVLVLCMLGSIFSFSSIAEETTEELPFIPMDIAFNTDIIGKSGQTTGDDWALYPMYADFKFGLSGDDDKVLAKNITNDVLPVRALGESSSNKAAEGDLYYSFSIDSESLSAGVKDAYVLENKGTTIKASGRPIDKIALLNYTFASSGDAIGYYTVNYTDGTTDFLELRNWWSETTVNSTSTATTDFSSVAWHGTEADGIDWHRNSQWLIPDSNGALGYYDKTAEYATNSTYTGKLGNSGSARPFQILYIDVDNDKIVESLTIKSKWGTIDQNSYYLAATEIPLTADVMRAKITAVEAYDESQAEEKSDDIMLAKRYSDELILRGVNTASDFSKLNTLAEIAEWYAHEAINEPFIPVSMTYTSDIIGVEGQEYDEATWATASSVKFGINGGSTHGILSNISTDNVLSVDKDGDATTEGSYSFYINREGLDAKKLDSIPLTSEKSFILNTSGRPVSQLAFLQTVLSGGTYRSLTFDLKYKDGTTATETTANFTQSTSTSLTNKFLSFSLKGTCDSWCRVKHGPMPGTDGKLVLDEATNSSTATGIYKVHYIDVDPTKELESVTISCNVKNLDMYLLAATEIPAATATLQEKIDIANSISVENISKENAADIILANRYADELVARYITPESEFTHLRSLKDAASWYENEAIDTPFIPMDITFNTDIIGKTGETVGDNWAKYHYVDSNLTNAEGHKVGLSGDSDKTLAKHIVNDKIEVLAEKSESSSVEPAADDKYFSFKITTDSLSVGDNDAYSLDYAGVKINASGRPVDKIALFRYAFANSGGPNAYYTVTYTDGTSDKVEVREYSNSTSQETPADATNLSVTYYTWNSSKTVSETNRSSHYLIPDSDGKLVSWVYDSGDTQETNKFMGYGSAKSFVVTYIDVDETKIVESLEINSKAAGTNYNIYYLAATEIPVATAELAKAIDDYQPVNYISTDAQSTEVKKLMWYANELEARYYKKASSYESLNKLYNQALAQDENYIDLTDIADADLLVSINDKPVGTPTRENYLYDGSKVPVNGMITAVAPSSDPDLITPPLAGTTYKFSGNYKNAGYDSVMVEKSGDARTIALSEKQLKYVSFILSSDIASEASDYVDVVVTYDDGTTSAQTVTVYGPNTTVGIKTNAYLQVSTVVKYDPDTNTYISGAGETIAAMKVVPAYAKIDCTKKVKSITFKPADDFNYAIMAVTEIPYKNSELAAAQSSLSAYTNKITESNALNVLELCAQVKEAYERTVLPEAVYNLVVRNYYNPAWEILNSVLSFTTEITTDSSLATATVTMVNTTSSPQPYQLIIVAYDSEDRLLNINFSEEKTLETNKVNVTDSVSLGIIAGATYKAFVWSGFGDMIPLAQ